MSAYFPEKNSWEQAGAAESGFDEAALNEAAAFAENHECNWPYSLYLDNGEYVGTAYVEEGPPWNEVIGIVRPRGPASGLIVKGGKIVASWGDTNRADTTFSAAKSYLGIVAGLAVADGRIRSVDDPVRDYALDEDFEPPHNHRITWRHLLQQTSEWQGTLWGKPDTVDHNRQAGPTHDNSQKGTLRTYEEPGQRWEYNDVRVNRLSLSLMQALRRPLKDVLRERIMDPIGASDDWDWRGYRNSIVEIDGKPMESVSGGGHWGGGLFIPTRDHARVGYLVLRNGQWAGRQLLPENWVREMTTPSSANPLYGYMWWLNTDRKLFPSAPAESVFALGGGQHVIWVDRNLDLVVVARWIDRAETDAFIARVMNSLR